jgi:NADP-dependent 3-hydroxy acid dehydrogenase YdfG
MVAPLVIVTGSSHGIAETYHAAKAAVRSLTESLQPAQAKNNVRVINIAPGFVKTNIHAVMGISFEEYCRATGNPDSIAPERIAEIVLFCYKQPQAICIRDLVVMPTTSAYRCRRTYTAAIASISNRKFGLAKPRRTHSVLPGG